MIRSGKISAFSLVEIAIAIGICSISLTAVMGLLSVSLGSSRESADDTIVATMADDVINDLRSMDFPSPALTAANRLLDGSGDVAAGGVPSAVTAAPIFFDAAGIRLKDGNGDDITRGDPQFANAVYQCVEIAQGDPDTLSATGSDGSTARQAVNLVRVKVTFTWPASAANPPNSRVIYASIARH